ncbi:MAG: hypothetical protein K9G58_14800 [Bacteroidales bacterium]|nr:hypothetical protein [Bacteroidales bacterium]MCF8387775.1 hypothetical protein [Bacteroidales bacterium]MCF8399439.1 hypothetical protein [Bacteroidales bacterium]
MELVYQLYDGRFYFFGLGGILSLSGKSLIRFGSDGRIVGITFGVGFGFGGEEGLLSSFLK